MNRFWSKVEKTENCWIWKSSINKNGYGQFSLNSKPVLAHRLSWILSFGEIGNDLCVLHRCDNSGCVNPAHLFIGTRKDNFNDMVNKRRDNFFGGNKRPNSKLDEHTVKKIREIYEPGKFSMPKIAKLFGVCTRTIQAIIWLESWNR